jgi:hypothetical protein
LIQPTLNALTKCIDLRASMDSFDGWVGGRAGRCAGGRKGEALRGVGVGVCGWVLCGCWWVGQWVSGCGGSVLVPRLLSLEGLYKYSKGESTLREDIFPGRVKDEFEIPPAARVWVYGP